MSSSVPELTLRRAVGALREYAEAKILQDAREQVRLTVEVVDDAVTLVEERVPWKEEYGPEWTRSRMAQFRFDAGSQHWTLYCPDRNQHWHRFEPADPSRDIDTLIRVVDRDETGIFWG